MFMIFAVEETASVQSVMRNLEASFFYLFSNVSLSVTIMKFLHSNDNHLE